MEILSTVGLLSLFGLGKSSRMSPRKELSKYPSTNLSKINGTDIYNSRDFYNVQGEEAKLVTENFVNAKNPVVTNIIPRYYNTLSIKQDSEKIPNSNYDSKLIYSVIGTLDPETQKIITKKAIDNKNLLKIIPDNARMANEDWGLISGIKDGKIKNGELDTGLQVGGSLLPNRGYEDFTHNNMVPFYKGQLKQNMTAISPGNLGKIIGF